MKANSQNASPKISWDWGTAYELFASLHVLHNPDRFGLRGAWAAGVRSRLSPANRSILEDAQELFIPPVAWLYRLPLPKDAATALWAIGQIPAIDRLTALAFNADHPKEQKDIFKEVADRRNWTEQDVEKVRQIFQQRGRTVQPKTISNILDWWSRPDEFGERYLEALQSYQEVFFVEEERRIRPFLQAANAQAQELSQDIAFTELVERLTQGLEIAEMAESLEVVFAPSYWTTPLVIYTHLDAQRMILLYGCRPADAALVPGELVPDAMLKALKALADPTRLRVLRYLAVEPLTPSQLSNRLRLRAPTMIHHLNALRLAGLVHLSLDKQGEKRYAIREERVAEVFGMLEKFLEIKEIA
jgi:DNA-binding transcriptional ArsR family regulator/DNA-binding transcriptional MerR regulator